MGYREAVLLDSPLAYYRLGEGSGTTQVDSSGHSRDGTYNNGATPTATSLLATATDKALTCDGVDDYSNVPYGTWMQVTTAFSIEFWMKPATISGSHIAVARSNNATPFGNTWSWLFYQTGSQLTFYVFVGNSGTLGQVNMPAALVAGTTYHVVGTFDGTTMRLYINGSQVATAALSGTMNSGPNIDLTIGACHAGASSERFAGVIDEVAFYDSVLSATRVANHYSVGTTLGTASAAPSGTGTLTATGTKITTGAAALAGTGTLTASGEVIEGATANFGGTGTLAAVGEEIKSGTAAFSGTGALTADGIQVHSATGALAGTGALTAVGVPVSLTPPGATLRWVFREVGTTNAWTVPMNPDGMTSPLALTKQLSTAYAINGRPSSKRTPAAPKEWSFSGAIRSQEHYDNLALWAMKKGKVRITDHLGRTFEVVIIAFDADERKFNPKVPNRFRYTMKTTLLRRIA